MKLKNTFKYPFLVLDALRRKQSEIITSHTGLTSSKEKYNILSRELIKYKPQIVLELGSGASTDVILGTIAEWGGKLVSMEEKAEYAHRISTVSPKREYTYGMFRGVGYTDIPKLDYDFVYIDGPTTYWPSYPEGEKTFDFDFLNVVGNKPTRGLIDSRMSTTFVLSLIFSDKVTFDYSTNMGYIAPVTKHDMIDTDSIIRRLPMYFVKRR